MKVFKTIVWTSIFWILALVGLWTASFWKPMAVKAIIAALPEPVWMEIYNDGLKSGFVNGQGQCMAVEEIPVEEIPVEENTEDQNLNFELPEANTPQLLPITSETGQAQPSSAEEFTALQNKVTELEKNHWALVQELQAIFSTPEGMKLLPAPTPVAN